jgi:hypothetical protein
MDSAEARAVAGYLKALGVASDANAEPLIRRALARVEELPLEHGESRAAAAVHEAQGLVDQWLAECLGPMARSRRAMSAARISLVSCLRQGQFKGCVLGSGTAPPELLRAILTGAKVGIPASAPLAMRARPLSHLPESADDEPVLAPKEAETSAVDRRGWV